MSKTDTATGLLQACVADLYDGARRMPRTLAKLTRRTADAALRAELERLSGESEAGALRLAEAGCDPSGPPNLWMRGILRDARRDTRSIVPGVLLDIAQVGAVRKALAASIVSYDTLVAVAVQIGREHAQAAGETNRAELAAADERLRDHLARLCAHLAEVPDAH